MAKKPKQPKTLPDTSGVLNYGWSKGWLVDTPSRRVCVTCSHSNPRPGIVVGFPNGDKRTVLGVFPVIADMAPGQAGCDVSIITLTEPAPITAAAYQIAAPKNGSKIWILTQRGDFVTATLAFDRSSACGVAEKKSEDIIAGDSGLPWFDSSGNVLTHNYRSARYNETFGPLYGHKNLIAAFKETVEKAESSLQ